MKLHTRESNECYALSLTSSTLESVSNLNLETFYFITLFFKACPDITPGSKCDALSDCSGVECCFDTNFELGARNVYVKIRINCDANNLEYEIETEKYNKDLATLTDGTVFTL